MSDIFISYLSEDRDRILPLVNALEKSGWSVFWDRTIPAGKTYGQVIRYQIESCRTVVVVWTKNSVRSEWTLEEAEIGKARQILVPVLLDEIEPPFGFRRIQAANLAAWNGDSSSPVFSRLIADIAATRRLEAQRQAEEERLREQERQWSEEEARRKIDEQSRKNATRDHFFVCYAREDETFVLKLGENLKERGVPVWLDQWDIPPGADWDRSIDNAIYDCAKFIIVLSPQAVESREVRGELRIALDKHKPIIPVIHSACQIPRQLLIIQYVDFTSRGPDDEAALKRLLRTLATSTADPDVAQQVDATDRKRSMPEAARQEPESELKPGTFFRDKLRDRSQGPEMVIVQAGTFQMGDMIGDGDKSERPVHTVRINRPFAIGRYEVTFEEYDRFATSTGRQLPGDEGWGRGRLPAINVSWNDAMDYADWLSQQTSKRYRLPTEAEWEYAARAGTDSTYWWGNEPKDSAANCEYPRIKATATPTVPVGSFKNNPFGLYDTAGNVWEWVQDCWHKNYNGAPGDGTAWKETDGGICDQRVIRGGSWNDTREDSRSSYRTSAPTTIRNKYIGFRLAQDLD